MRWALARNVLVTVLVVVGFGLLFTPSLPSIQAGLLTIWAGAVVYAGLAPQRRFMLLAFLGVFFLFLLGRDLLIDFFGFPRSYELSHRVEFRARLLMGLGLVGVLTGYVLGELWDRRRHPDSTSADEPRGAFRAQVGRLGLLVFAAVLPLSLVSKGMQAAYVLRHGYYAYYTDYVVMRQDDIVVLALSKIEYMLPAALAAFLASLPGRRALVLPLAGWLVYCLLALGTGMRFTTMGGIALVLVYLVARQPSLGLVNRRAVVGGVLALPVVAGGLAWWGYARAGQQPLFSGPLGAVLDFLYTQGVTGNMVKYALVYEADLPQHKLYSFEFLFTGLIGRLTGASIYHGNNVEHAMDGHSFAHALSYTVLGRDAYYGGQSTGTTYLAELNHDFGLVGVVLGSVVVGLLLMQISNIDRVTSHPFVTFLRIIVIYDLLWLPRGNFGSFLTRLTAPSTLLVIAAVFGGAWLLRVLLERGLQLPGPLHRLLLPSAQQPPARSH